jgi:hypothetical protein
MALTSRLRRIAGHVCGPATSTVKKPVPPPGAALVSLATAAPPSVDERALSEEQRRRFARDIRLVVKPFSRTTGCISLSSDSLYKTNRWWRGAWK